MTLLDWSCTKAHRTITMPYYLTPKKDDYNQIPELQVCLAEALYDIESSILLD